MAWTDNYHAVSKGQISIKLRSFTINYEFNQVYIGACSLNNKITTFLYLLLGYFINFACTIVKWRHSRCTCIDWKFL